MHQKKPRYGERSRFLTLNFNILPMSKTHYDPFKPTYDPYGEDSSEYGYCGTLLSENEDNSTNDKKYVTCKKCIKKFDRADEEMKFHSDNFANDCQGFLEYINQ